LVVFVIFIITTKQWTIYVGSAYEGDCISFLQRKQVLCSFLIVEMHFM